MNAMTNVIIVFNVILSVCTFANPSAKLWNSARSGNLGAAKTAISKSADVNYFGSDGSTPLWQAAFFGHDEIVELLLNNEADPLIRPILVAKEQGEKSGLTRLSPRGWLKRRSSSESLLPLPKKALVSASGSLIDEKSKEVDSEVSPRYRKEASLPIGTPIDNLSPHELGLPIHVGIKRGHVKVIKALLEFGDPKQIEEQDSQGNNALHLIALAENPEIFSAVIDHRRAKTYPRYFEHMRIARMRSNETGLLPMHIVAKYGGARTYVMAFKFLQFGDDIHSYTRDGRGETPFEIVQNSRDDAIIEGDQMAVRSCSKLMLLMANLGPEVVVDRAEHLALRLVGKMILDQRNAISNAGTVRDGSEDPLDATVRNLLNFCQPMPSDEESSIEEVRRRRFSATLRRDEYCDDENAELCIAEISRRGDGEKEDGGDQAGSETEGRDPSFYGYGSDLEINGEFN